MNIAKIDVCVIGLQFEGDDKSQSRDIYFFSRVYHRVYHIKLLFHPSGHRMLKKRQVLVEFWSLRHLTLRQRHSDVRFITSYIRPIRYIISTL